MLYQPFDGWWIEMHAVPGHQWRWYALLPLAVFLSDYFFFDSSRTQNQSRFRFNAECWMDRYWGTIQRRLEKLAVLFWYTLAGITMLVAMVQMGVASGGWIWFSILVGCSLGMTLVAIISWGVMHYPKSTAVGVMLAMSIFSFLAIWFTWLVLQADPDRQRLMVYLLTSIWFLAMVGFYIYVWRDLPYRAPMSGPYQPGE